jgi:hypothetical protein
MRKRATDPRIPIHVTLKRSTIDNLDQQLKHNQSRSKFVDAAILEKLKGYDEVEKLSSKDLLFELLFRGVLNNQTYHMYLNTISEDA